MLDKCRAVLAGTNGEYNYACLLDQLLVKFTGIDADALKEQVAAGRNDAELLEWVNANAAHKPDMIRILAWSAYVEAFVPGDTDMRGFFQELQGRIAPHRKDIQTLFDLLDLDDYVSFGGKA